MGTNHKHKFEGIGWYLVKGLGSFGNTADDFVGPFTAHNAALKKWFTYDGNDVYEILFIADDGFAYVDNPKTRKKV